MPSALSIKIGDLLYKHAFPVYNIVYPVFKNRQDKQEILLLKKYIKSGDIVLDIGANIGFYTKILSELVGPTGKVYAFEPDKTNFTYLQRNAGHLKNVELINKAVSDKTDTITLYKSDLLNVDHKTYATQNYTSTSVIDCIKADDVVDGRKVNFIKIDIQGYEYYAFQGMQEILKANNELKIISEFYPFGIQESGVSLVDFFNCLTSNNFNIFLCESDKLTPFKMEDISTYENLGKYVYFNLCLIK
ncbi:MAG: FkbM family methyltransferase [Chitinophagales bacterium]|jgi:FkbM family methyltransferase|nr:FkbM family methyltransferase [Chitinophagales bacterium]